MYAARFIAVIWLLGSIYILIASRFSPGIFGTITIALAMPAAIGILMRWGWAIIPAVLLCVAWGGIAVLLMTLGNGVTFNNVVLLIAAILCAATVLHGHRGRNGSNVTFEYR